MHEIIYAGGEGSEATGPEAGSFNPGPQPEHAARHGAAVDRVIDIGLGPVTLDNTLRA